MYEIQITTKEKLITVYTQANSVNEAIYKACNDSELTMDNIKNLQIVDSKIAYIDMY